MADTRTPDTTVHEPATTAAGPGPAIADPSPLGLAGFAMTTFVLSCINANLLKQGTTSVVISLALFYGGGAQLLAGMWEFRKNNTFGALAFGSFGAFWLSYAGIAFWYHPTGVTATQATHAVGVYLLAWTIFTAYLAVASMRVSGAVFAVLVMLTATFLVLCIGALGQASATAPSSMTKVGGWLGLITAVLAWYTSFAVVTNATWKKTVLPTWPAKTR
jgi:succinate-acetate transporter protein